MKRIAIAVTALSTAAALVVAGGALLPAERSSALDRGAPGATRAVADPVGGVGDTEVEDLEQRIAAEPSDAGSLALLGFAYLERARATADPVWYTRAEEVLERSLEIDPEAGHEAPLGMAVLAGARHDFVGSLRWAKRAERINPDASLIHGVKGDALLQLGRSRAATAAFQKMMDLKPTFGGWARVAYLAEVRGDTNGALHAMREALRSVQPGTEDAAWTRYQIAELYAGSGALAVAQRQYERAVAEAPNYYLPREGLGHMAFTRGDYQGAIDHISSVVADAPLPDYVISLGDLYRLTGDESAAEEQYARALTLLADFHAAGVLPDTEEAVFFADGKRDPRRALEIARRLMQTRSRNAEVRAAYAWALRSDGQLQEARRQSRAALRLGTRDSQTLFFAGMIAKDLGDEPRARHYLRESLTADPYFSFRHAPLAKAQLATLSARRP